MPDAKTQWRLTISATQSDVPGLATFELRATMGGADLATSGTASASSVYSGSYPASNVNDGNTATAWYSSTGFPQWIQIDFAAATDITEYLLRAPPGYPNEAPKTWTLAHNDGAGGWTEVDAQTDVAAWSNNEERTYFFGTAPEPGYLGELLAHHFHPARHALDLAYRDRSGPAHHFHPARRKPAHMTPVYLVDFAHYPIRLNGRAAAAYYGPSGHDGPPWTLAGQAATDANGRIFHHPHRWRLHWLVSPGSRSLSVPVLTNYSGGIRPRVVLRANAALGVAADHATDDVSSIPHAFPDATYPPATSTDSSYELGTRFTPTADTRCTGLRFYRPSVSANPVTGRLWTAAGTLLAAAAYDLSGTGWQSVDLVPPVELDAGQSYVASYNVTVGDDYAYQHHYFDAAHAVDIMTAPANIGGAPNGLYITSPGSFPTGSFNNALYFADLIFEAEGSSGTLTVHANPTLSGLLTVDLIHADPTLGRTCTWGTITAA